MTLLSLRPRMNPERLFGYINLVVRYVTICVSWFEAALECGRVPVSDSCG